MKKKVTWFLAITLFVVMAAACFTFVSRSAQQAAAEETFDVELSEEHLQIDGGVLKGLNALGKQQVDGSKTYKINLPETVTSIAGNGESSYFDEYLVAVSGESLKVTNIGDYAFAGCTGLKTFTYTSSSMYEVGSHAFENCAALTRFANAAQDGDVYFGSVSVFGDYAFAGCASIKRIMYWYALINNIGNHTFEGCESLQDVIMNPSQYNITTLGESVFEGCTNLSRFYLDSATTSVGDSAFKNCTSLRAINIPEGLTKVGTSNPASVFEGCSNLECVVADSKSHKTAMESNIASFGISQDKLTYPIDVNLNEGGQNGARIKTLQKLYRKDACWRLNTLYGWYYDSHYSLSDEFGGEAINQPAWFRKENPSEMIETDDLSRYLTGGVNSLELIRKYPIKYYQKNELEYEMDWKQHHTYNCQHQAATIERTSFKESLELDKDYKVEYHVLTQNKALGSLIQKDSIINAGIYCILLKAVDTSYYCYGTYNDEFLFFIDPVDLSSDGNIEVSTDTPLEWTFDGKVHKPEVELKFKYGEGQEYTLQKNVDYTTRNDSFFEGGTHHLYVSALTPYSQSNEIRGCNFTGTKDLEVTVHKIKIGNKNVEGDDFVELTYRIDPNACVFTGSELRPSVVFEFPGIEDFTMRSSDMKMDYTSNIHAGTCYVTATALESNDYCEGTFRFTFEITPAQMSSVTVGNVPFVTYDGKSHKPEPDLYLRDYKLTKDTDYTIEYEADSTNVGTKVITFKAETSGLYNKDFTGSTTIEFKIQKRNLSGQTVNVTFPKETYTYRGEPIEAFPNSVSLSIEGGELTLYAKDYTLDYVNNENVGQANIVFIATEDGNFSGRVSSTFTISPAQMSSVEITKLSEQQMPFFDGKEHFIGGFSSLKLGNSANLNKYTLSEKDYELVFDGSDYTSCGEKTVKIKAKSSNFEGETTNTYKVRQRALSIYSPPHEIKVNYGKTPVYTGLKIEPKVESVLIKFTADDSDYYTMLEKDYTVAYGENNINAGSDAAIIIKATAGGNFTGEYTANFAIARKPLTDEDIIIAEQKMVFDGKSHLPEPQFSLNGAPFVSGKDFTIVGEAKVNAGTYECTIQSTTTGNLSGERTISFEIERRDIADANVVISSWGGEPLALDFNGYHHNSAYVKVEVTISIDGGDTLSLNQENDYSLEFIDDLYPGEAKITITGKEDGNYCGEAHTSFTIAKGKISNSYMMLDPVTYDGTERKISEVRFGEITLREGVDYNVIYDADMVNAGKKKLTFVAIPGDYFVESQVETTLTINQVSLSYYRPEITFEGGATFSYTGAKIEPRIATFFIQLDGGARVEVGADQYTLEYGENIKLGMGTILIFGKYDYLEEEQSTYSSNFIGSTSFEFEIVPRDISTGLQVTFEREAYSYTGSSIFPNIASIQQNGTALNLQSTDYYVFYGTNTDVGQGAGSITINGYGQNVTGSFTAYFDITAMDLEDADIQEPSDIVFDGKDHKPADIEIRVGFNRLVKGRDYEISYDSADYYNVGTKQITISAISSNITGQRVVTFTISKRELSGASSYTLEYEGGSNFTYTGSQIAPKVQSVTAWFMYDEVVLTDAEYEVAYGENINAGVGTITITAKADGNCTGSFEQQITIQMAQNQLVQDFNLQSFRKGENVTEPAVEALFGEVTITYDDFNGHTYTFSQLKNANPGHYRATIIVEGTSNYTAISTTREFDILDENGNNPGGGGTGGQGSGTGGQGGQTGGQGSGTGGQGGQTGGQGSGSGENKSGGKGGNGAVIGAVIGAVGAVTIAAAAIVIVKVKKSKKKIAD